MSRADAKRTLRHRREEASREMAVLLLVFAPIDLVIAADTWSGRTWMLIFLALGLFLLGVSLASEFRRLDVG